MFNIRKNKNGELLLDINFHPFRFLYNLLSSLDYLFSSKVFYTIPMGLGLGFGFAIIVFAQPKAIRADSIFSQVSVHNLVITELIISQQNLSLSLEKQANYTLLPLRWTNNNVFFSSVPNQKNQIVIGSKDIEIEKITLGEKITVIANNNGQYSFSVYEVKQIDNNEINYLMANNESQLIILSPENQLGTKYLAALAK